MKNEFYHPYKDSLYEAVEAILKGTVTNHIEEAVPITKSYSVNQSDLKIKKIIKDLIDAGIPHEVQDYLPHEKGCDIVITKPTGRDADKKIAAIETILG